MQLTMYVFIYVTVLIPVVYQKLPHSLKLLVQKGPGRAMLNCTINVRSNDTLFILIGTFTITAETVASICGLFEHSRDKSIISGINLHIEEGYLVVH